jgi:DNA modification methylase
MIRKELQHLAIEIDEIHTHPSNVRQGDVGAICESLKAHGQYRAIVFQKSTGRILAGNHTWKAAKALGWTQIAATPVVCDDQQALRILLADNKANDLATYDEPELIELLKQLADTDEGLLGTLFDEDELDSLIADQSHFELPSDVDDVPEDVPAVSKLGDVWLLGDHRVMCGDSTNLEMIGKLLDSKTINMVFTDPPYGISIVQGASVGGEKLAKTGKYRPIINDNTTQTAINTYNICKELNIAVQIWWGGNYYASALPDSPCWIVWDKENTGNFADAELAWTNQPTATRIFKHMWNGMIRASEQGSGSRVHPTQKPIALAVWCFNEYGNEGDIVLDLFGGSGSTLIAAQETNRVAYLMELDPHYVDVICARYQKHTGNQPVLEATGEAHDFTPDAD